MASIFEGKNPAERNKLIAAIVLGVLAIITLGYTFSGMFFPSKPKTTSAKNTENTAPKTTSTGDVVNDGLADPTDIYANSPVIYDPAMYSSRDAGRNIFAFYEPPAYVATPIPAVDIKQTPIPTPIIIQTPPPPTPIQYTLSLGFMNVSSVFAGGRGFKLEVNGDKFTPETAIYFNGNMLPTTFISPQRLTAEISSNLIANAGQINIDVHSPDGKLFSNPMTLMVNAPPKPQFQYIGMIARSRYNNDTAYLLETGKKEPTSARLNDVVGGRFKMASISSQEVVVEDKELGFKYRLALERPKAGQAAGTNQPGGRGNIPGIPQGFPPGSFQPGIQPGENPIGIPGNIPRYVPPQKQPTTNKDEDEDDDGDGGN
jgi:hypothetical protein